MNNAFFGKTMENVRKRRHIDLVSTSTKLKSLTAQPTFNSIKGIQKCVVKQNINFDHYKSSIYNKTKHIASTCSLRSNLHEIQTLAINKVATGPYDDKRYLLDDGISSLPYGHYAIEEKIIGSP